MKRGHLTKEEIRFSSEWTWGGELRGRNGPAGMGSGERRQDWRSQHGKGGASFPSKPSYGKGVNCLKITVFPISKLEIRATIAVCKGKTSRFF